MVILETSLLRHVRPYVASFPLCTDGTLMAHRQWLYFHKKLKKVSLVVLCTGSPYLWVTDGPQKVALLSQKLKKCH